MNWDWGPCRPRHYCTGAENSCNTAVSCTGFPGGSSYYTGCKWYHSCPYDSWYWYGSDPCYRIRNTDKSTCDALAPFYVKGSCRPADPNAAPRICHARTEYVVVKASESDDVRRLLGDIRPVVPNTRKSIRCFCALRFLIPALLYMYPLLCRGTLDKVRETLEKRANAMTDERDGDDPPLFDLAGWLTTELEEDLGAVFTMCANLTDSALFLVDEMRSWGVFDAGTSLAVNLMDPFTFEMEPGGAPVHDPERRLGHPRRREGLDAARRPHRAVGADRGPAVRPRRGAELDRAGGPDAGADVGPNAVK